MQAIALNDRAVNHCVSRGLNGMPSRAGAGFYVNDRVFAVDPADAIRRPGKKIAAEFLVALGLLDLFPGRRAFTQKSLICIGIAVEVSIKVVPVQSVSINQGTQLMHVSSERLMKGIPADRIHKAGRPDDTRNAGHKMVACAVDVIGGVEGELMHAMSPGSVCSAI